MALMTSVTSIVVAVCLLFSLNSALAAGSTVGKSNWSADLSATQDQSLFDFRDGTKRESFNLRAIPSYALEAGRLSATLSYNKDLRDEFADSEAGLEDIPISFSLKPIPLPWINDREQAVSLNNSVSLIAPSSKISRIRDELITSISAKVGLGYTNFRNGITARGSVSLGRNFHRYEENSTGNVLNAYSSTQNLGLGYARGDWNFDLDFFNRSRWTYKGGTKSSFEISESASYSINPNYYVVLGHSNSGNTLKDNGEDLNIDLTDESNSIVYVTLGAQF